MPFTLDSLLPHLPVWTLVLFRLTGIFVLAPLFGSTSIPGRVKVLWVLGLSFCIYPLLLDSCPAAALLQPANLTHASIFTLVPAVALELAVGVVIGYGASLPIIGMQVAGHVADQQIGLGMAGIFNPQIEEESGVIGEFYYLLAMMIFLAVGGHRVLLQTLLASFDHVPLGGFGIDDRLIGLLLGLLASMFELALRVAAPLLCLVFLETVAMGFIARTVPQLNILSVGFPLRILIGVGVLIAALSTQAGVFAQALRHSLNQVAGFFGS